MGWEFRPVHWIMDLYNKKKKKTQNLKERGNLNYYKFQNFYKIFKRNIDVQNPKVHMMNTEESHNINFQQ
jgi:hypothetical protein